MEKKIQPKQTVTTTTITACATGFPGAISLIRLSGDKTKTLLESCFFSKKEMQPRFVRTGKIETDGISDTTTAVFFKAPDSYTGEDMAEISVHANPVLVQKILQFLIKHGAESAKKGEFTYRAFLNGKMDLTAAEAVTDIINAESESEIKHAYRQMKGELKQKIDFTEERLTEILASLNAAIDFPEENVETDALAQTETAAILIEKELKALADSYERGRLIKNGIKAAIVGGVNVGKSSLLNALLKKERAIVTDIPGTTRDTIEDRFEYKGQKFIIIDTAGIRKSGDIVEEEGIERTKKAAQAADIIIAVTEAGKPFDKQTAEVLENLKKSGKKIILAENKTDIFKACINNSIGLSAKTGQNIDVLKEKLFNESIGAETSATDCVTVTDLRHYQALLRAADGIKQALYGIKQGLTPDFIAADLMLAYNELGHITGKSGSDTLIETIFSRFCVGK